MPLRYFFTLRPLTSTASSALAYVPAVLVSRALAFVRTLCVAWILAKTWSPAHAQTLPAAADSQSEFGLYQTSLEFINVLVPLLMLGAGDVLERYLSRMLRDQGPQALVSWTRLLFIHLLGRAVPALLLLYVFAGIYVHDILAPGQYVLLNACLVTVLLLACYQFLASLLRGMRAYGAAAGMELASAMFLLVFSAVGAYFGRAYHLVGAYAVSILLPLAYYAPLAYLHLKRSIPLAPSPGGAAVSSSAPEQLISDTSVRLPRTTRAYAAFTLLRLLLMMLFSFLAIWGVRTITGDRPMPVAVDALAEAGNFAIPYRIAQLLGFLGVTLWASVFAIAAASHSHGNRRRGDAQYFRVGRLGGALLVFCATGLLLARPVIARLLPDAYHAAILALLPGMLALFTWYALLAFFSFYADLLEKPWKGMMFWLAATLVQLAAIVSVKYHLLSLEDPKSFMLMASCTALAIPLFVLVPLLLCRPFRFSATAVPMLVLCVAPIALLSPDWVVLYFATPVLLAALVFLYTANLLLRPVDRKAFRRWWKRLRGTLAPPSAASSDALM